MLRPSGVNAALAAAFVSFAGLACEGGPPSEVTPPDAGQAADVRPPASDATPQYAGKLPLTDTPYRVVRGRGPLKGASLAPSELFGELAAADAVCLGELHDNDDHHGVQLLALDELLQRAAAQNRRVALGMEMFQKPFQSLLDEYAAGQITEQVLLLQAQWRQRWGFDFSYYRPLVEAARGARAPLLALNAAQELTNKVSRDGLGSLSPEERAELPELDLTNEQHRAWFREAVSGHVASSAERLETMYTIQVIRDETMADLSWRWLQAQSPGPRQIAILAGTGHCMDLAIPARLRRRGARTVVSVRPVAEDAEGVREAVDEEFSDYVVVYAGTP